MNRNHVSERIRQWIEQHAEAATHLVQKLVQIESVNHPPHGNERAYQLYFAEQLKELGADVETYELSEVKGLTEHPAYMPGREYKDRPNVVGRFRSKGKGKSLLFTGHGDTVYEGLEQWTYPPFSGTIREGKLYGRGSYDMKGGMAAALMAIKCLQDLNIQVNGDVIVESVVDEEHGGANGTLAGRLYGIEADMAILPEPSNLEVATDHVGGGIWKATFSGKSGIGFAGEKLVSALDAAVEFVKVLQAYQADREVNLPLQAPFSHRPGAVIMSLQAGDPARELQEKVPGNAECTFWIEGYPGVTGDQILQDFKNFMNSRLDEHGALRNCPPQIDAMIRYLDGSGLKMSDKEKNFVELVCKLGEQVTGEEKKPGGAGFGCDGFMFNLHSNTPVLILGPKGGNAHAADEFLEIDGYLQLVAWYAELIVNWCGIGNSDCEEGGDAR